MPAHSPNPKIRKSQEKFFHEENTALAVEVNYIALQVLLYKFSNSVEVQPIIAQTQIQMTKLKETDRYGTNADASTRIDSTRSCLQKYPT